MSMEDLNYKYILDRYKSYKSNFEADEAAAEPLTWSGNEATFIGQLTHTTPSRW